MWHFRDRNPSVVVQSYLTLSNSMDCSMSDFLVLHYLTVCYSCILSQWCYLTISSFCPLLLPSIFPSIRVFSSSLALLIRWPRYWCFIFNSSLFHKYSGFISFRIDRFGILAVQGTLKSPLQHHNLKESILQDSTFFMAQLFIHTWLLEKP